MAEFVKQDVTDIVPSWIQTGLRSVTNFAAAIEKFIGFRPNKRWTEPSLHQTLEKIKADAIAKAEAEKKGGISSKEFRLHGNYCGPGWTSGKWMKAKNASDRDWSVKPQDRLDFACKEHDWDCGHDPEGCSTAADTKLIEAAMKEAKKHGYTKYGLMANAVANGMTLARSTRGHGMKCKCKKGCKHIKCICPKHRGRGAGKSMADLKRLQAELSIRMEELDESEEAVDMDEYDEVLQDLQAVELKIRDLKQEGIMTMLKKIGKKGGKDTPASIAYWQKKADRLVKRIQTAMAQAHEHPDNPDHILLVNRLMKQYQKTLDKINSLIAGGSIIGGVHYNLYLPTEDEVAEVLGTDPSYRHYWEQLKDIIRNLPPDEHNNNKVNRLRELIQNNLAWARTPVTRKHMEILQFMLGRFRPGAPILKDHSPLIRPGANP